MNALNKNIKKPSIGRDVSTTRNVSSFPPAAKRDAAGFRRYVITNAMLMALLFVITFICYINTLQNQFIANWDDRTYVVYNTWIKGLDTAHLKMLLFHCITPSNYHPLTMLSLAINYFFSGLHPESYYFTNIMIHIFNTLLVFLIAKKLLEMMKINGYGNLTMIPYMAAFSALFFAIHPMHVESVSWIPERKDVLYAFFYFLGVLMYLYYAEKPSIKGMVWVVLFFILSCLSKGMAVTFPLSLFAIDILLKRRLAGNLVFEKIPLFLIALFFGILAYFVQNAVHGVVTFLGYGYTVFLKLLIPFYALLIYTIKAFIPVKLACYHQIPILSKGDSLPLLYYLSPVLDVAIISIPLYLCRRAGENFFRVALFGIIFYLSNLVFVLQFLSVSSAVVSERYTYIAYFGLFFMLIYFLWLLWEKKLHFHLSLQIACVAFSVLLFYLCYERTKVWHYDVTLWKDEIDKYPDYSLPYQELAFFYYDKKDTDDAIVNYTKSVSLGSVDPMMYYHLANLYSGRRQFDNALTCYTKAIGLSRPENTDFTFFLDRGNIYAMMGKADLALQDYDNAYKLDPDSNDLQLLRNRAFLCFSNKMFTKAIRDFTHITYLKAATAFDYETLGWAEYKNGDANAALENCLHSLGMEPNNPQCLFNLSIIYGSIKKYGDAFNYALKARQAGVQVSDDYLNNLKKKAGM